MGRVQTGRYDGFIRRLFSIKGGGSLLAETLGDAFPVLQLEGGPIELYKLAGMAVGIGGGQSVSPVGQTVGGQLFNAANSGKIVIVTTARFSIGATQIVRLGVTAVPLAIAFGGRERDTREGVLQRTVGTVRHGNNPAVPTDGIFFQVSAGVTFTFEDSDGLAVLAPGTGLTLTSVNTNQTLNSAFWWRERLAEPSELNF